MKVLFFCRASGSVGGTSVGHVVGGRVVGLVVWAGVCLVVVEPDGFIVAESDAKAKNRNL